MPIERAPIDRRVLFLCALGVGLGLVAGLIARILTALIGLITNLAFYGRWSTSFVGPADNHLGGLVVLVPVVGGLVVGLMARYGSAAIRGHGIPEAMEQVLFNESRIPARMTFLKPLSAAVSIGTGGPFGAEGPIIATGGALGSFVGQVLRVSADERKTLLAAGAAAGMSATFSAPVSAVLLAIELLLFEYRARSLIPVALASAAACAAHIALVGSAPRLLDAHPRRTERRGSGGLRRDGHRRRVRVDAGDARRLRGRRRVREAPDPLDVVARDGRSRRRWRRHPVAAHHGRRLRQHRSDPLGRPRGPGGRRLLRPQVRLVGALARHGDLGRNARAALHDRRRHRLDPRRARCERVARGRGRHPRRGARRHGCPLRRRVARAARLGRLCLRDDPSADDALAAPRRLHRGVPHLGPADATVDHDREDRAARWARRHRLRRRPVRADPRLGHRAGSGRRAEGGRHLRERPRVDDEPRARVGASRLPGRGRRGAHRGRGHAARRVRRRAPRPWCGRSSSALPRSCSPTPRSGTRSTIWSARASAGFRSSPARIRGGSSASSPAATSSPSMRAAPTRRGGASHATGSACGKRSPPRSPTPRRPAPSSDRGPGAAVAPAADAVCLAA